MKKGKDNDKAYHFLWKGKYIYLMAFLIPTILFLTFMLIMQITPFGDRTLLISDGLAQSYPWFMEFYRKVHAGEALWFSWNMGSGANFYTTACPMLLSPMSWLLVLLPESWLQAGYGIGILLELALASVTMTFYFMHSDVLRNSSYVKQLSLLAGLGYGMSSAVLSYYYITSWPEVYVLFPLLVYALELLIKKNKRLPYYILLTYLLLLNQYIAYMICIFLVLWFIYQADIACFKKRFAAFAVTSVLSALSAMVTILPVLYTYIHRSSGADKESVSLLQFGNPWDVLNMLFPLNVMDSMGEAYETYNVYCGSILFLTALFYLFVGKEKGAKGKKLKGLFLFMWASLFTYALIYFWHVFAFPHMLANRFAFIFVFVLLYTGCRGILSMIEASIRRLAVFLIIAVLLFTGTIMFVSGMSTPEVYVTVMLVWAFVLMFAFLQRKGSIKAKVYINIIVVMGILELSATTVLALLQNDLSRGMAEDPYVYGKEAFEKAENAGERTAFSEVQFHNSGALFGVQTAGLFSSIIPENYLNWYKKLGLFASEDGLITAYRGGTMLTDCLMNVGSVVTENYSEYTGEIKEKVGAYYLMETAGGPGYGFMLPDTVLSAQMEHDNAFENQNQLFLAMGGTKEIFTGFDLSELAIQTEYALAEQTDANTIKHASEFVADAAGEALKIETFEEAAKAEGSKVVLNGSFFVEFLVPEDMDLYIYLRDMAMMGCNAYVNGEMVKQGYATADSELLHIGDVKKGQGIALLFSDVNPKEAVGELHIYAAAFHQDIFEEFRSQVAEEAFILRKINGSGMEGYMTAAKDGMLYMSVADDGGFTVYVDGKKTAHKLLADCMICVPVSAGAHEIKLAYTPPGFLPGALISLVTVLAVCIICRKRKGTDRNRKEHA
ncbi:MAG: YfhO family protein [Lachnospiraceae bacterium]|nr:YfhO family protein [Lachnospiraceae bacterium]